MTVLTLTRVSRRMFRKLAKPLLLKMNTWARQRSTAQVEALEEVRQDASALLAAEHRYQVYLAQERKRIEWW